MVDLNKKLKHFKNVSIIYVHGGLSEMSIVLFYMIKCIYVHKHVNVRLEFSTSSKHDK